MFGESNDNILHQFYAYHGTDEESSIDILSDGFKIFSDNRDDHWLGNGVYFFREDETQALFWAQNKVRKVEKLNGKPAVVIRALIAVNSDNYLNMDSRDGLDIFEKHIEQTEKELKESGLQITFKNENQQRHYFMNLLPDKYHVIKRTFNVNSKKYDSNKHLADMKLWLNGEQICIRNLSTIKNIKVTRIEKVKLVVTKSPNKKPRLLH
ncbi:hypothetical protein CN272_27980 [Bacillus anthracis]|nr:hypothetical protein CN272_27980 [Bacillus anthracis]PFD87199.1 hypothetical protein CN275_20230 [Bacillus anthracis]PFT20052.1 hypothetical protein COK52_22720 [Bacillus thuringiensis]